jgi:hypothetical protein
VKKLIGIGTGAVGAAVAAMGLFGSGVAAAAPDVVGMLYSDASTAISDAGATAVISVRVGDKAALDQCLVTNAWDSPHIRAANDGSFAHAKDEVMLALNCNGAVATANFPGNSAASPTGRDALAKQQAAPASG